MTTQVLLVDDDAAVREALGQTLELGGYQPILAGSFIEAKDHVAAEFDGVVISDIRMPGKDGFALLAHVRQVDDDLPVILLTGEGDIPTAVRGMQNGAYDFLEKPCAPKHLLEVVGKAMQTRALVLENRRLKRELDAALHARIGFLGVSAASRQVRAAIVRAGRADTPVLISGEAGSGRGYVARLVQEARGQREAVRVLRCTGPLDLGPGDDAPVLFCDIERLSPSDQARLMAALRDLSPGHVMAVTGPDPERLVQDGVLDDELFYALGVARIHVPALAERREDIPILFDKFLREEIDAGAPVTSAEGQAALRGLAGLDWTGNLRALRNHTKRIAWGLEDGQAAPGLKEQLERVERGIIQDALRRHAGHATETARALNLPRKTFYDRLQKLGIRAESYRD
ncbi:MAG: response regulator [Rhodobacteraceae bacterium]|nr:response regulator [Paracoccaceae bacterium]